MILTAWSPPPRKWSEALALWDYRAHHSGVGWLRIIKSVTVES